MDSDLAIKVRSLIFSNKRDDGWTELAQLGLRFRENDIDCNGQKLKRFLEIMDDGSFEWGKDMHSDLPLIRIKESVESGQNSISNRSLGEKTAKQALLDFAFFDKKDKTDEANGFQQALKNLKGKSLREDWDYEKDSGQYRILGSYLCHTFERLLYEEELHKEDKEWKNKIMEKDGLLIFNTGLVDRLYRPIYAVFEKNKIPNKQKWYFVDFVASEGIYQRIVKVFGGANLPKSAHYYDNTSELVYNLDYHLDSQGYIEHVITHLERLPLEFLKRVVGGEFDFNQKRDKVFYDNLSRTIKDSDYLFRVFNGRLDDAIEVAKKRVQWNFKTAIPIYYPRTKKISLLLPLNLVKDDKTDVALVLEVSDDSKTYIAHTIFTLNIAYKDARLITRPDSDWLVVKDIKDDDGDDENNEDYE